MTHKIKQWTNYIESHLKKGYSKSDIRKYLISKGYNEEYIDLVFKIYEQQKTTKILSILSGLTAILLLSFIFITYPNLTGKVINIIGVGTNKIYYVDSINGNDNNNGLSINNAFKTLNYAFSKLKSGDILYLIDGTYYLNSSLTLNNVYFDSAVIITDYDQNNNIKPTIKANILKFEYPNETTWQNVSFNGLNIWASDYSTSDTVFIAYYNDTKVNLFSYNNYNDLKNSSKPEGIYYNITNQKLLIRFKDINKNPNKISLIISHRIPFYFTNVKGKGFVISGLNIEGAVRCAYISASDNILIQNNSCVNALKGFDIRGTSNITITNNLIYMKPGDFSWKDMKLSLMETSALYLQDNLEDVNASYNEIFGYFNGILTYATADDKFFNIDVGYNKIYDIYDDAIEIEDFCNKGHYHHNNISDVFVGFSLSPAQALKNKCYVYNNLIIADKLERWDNYGNYYKGECFKIIDNLPAGYMEYFKNTCIGRGIYTTTTNRRTQINSSWTNNIFYSKDQKLIQKSGLSIDGIFFDNNLYFREDGGTIFQYWNSDTSSIEFTSLDQAKQSNQWDGKWDINSLNLNPLFMDPLNKDFRLKPESPACNIKGDYVGAFPCENINNNQNIEINTEQPLNFNSPPLQNYPKLISSLLTNTTDEDLICLNQSTYDADNDQVINIIKWFKNSKEISEYENMTIITKDLTNIDDIWQCQITPFDGKDYGNTLLSNKLKILKTPVCGDNICELNENCITCSYDCGSCNISNCNLENVYWNEDEFLINHINLNECFKDPLNETLEFYVEGNVNSINNINNPNSSNYNINLEIKNGFVSFSSKKDYYGKETIRFIAKSNSLPERIAFSNFIDLNIINVPDCGDKICELNENCYTCSLDCKCPTSTSNSRGGISGGSVNINYNNLKNDKDISKNSSQKIKNDSNEKSINESLEKKELTINNPSNLNIKNNEQENISKQITEKQINNYERTNLSNKKNRFSWFFIIQGITIIILSVLIVKINLNKHKFKSDSQKNNQISILKNAKKPFVKNNIRANNLYELAMHIYNMPQQTFIEIKDDLKHWINNYLDMPEISETLSESESKENLYNKIYNLYQNEFFNKKN